MRFLVFYMALFSCAVEAGESRDQQIAAAQRHELDDIGIDQLRQVSYSNLALYGFSVGMPFKRQINLSQVYGVKPKELRNLPVDEIDFYDIRGGLPSGVALIISAGNIFSMSLIALTDMEEPATRQYSYITRMGNSVRSFFENYSDALRRELFGETTKEIDTNGAWFRRYFYDYRSRGIILEVTAFSRHGWREQLASFRVYDPANGFIPPRARKPFNQVKEPTQTEMDPPSSP